jgi:hypothetical protein
MNMINKKASLVLILVFFALSCVPKESAKYNLVIREEFSIGKEEGDQNYMFAQISDLCTDDKLNIYVLDSRKMLVMVYDKNGLFKFSFGQAGQGPGQFDVPKAIASFQDKVYVLDFFKVHLFRTDGTFLSSFPLDFRGIDMAVNDKGELVVLGPRKQNIFHVYNNGKLLYSYGELFEMPERFAQFKNALLFRLPFKIYICGAHTYAMNPYQYEIIVWEDRTSRLSLKRDEPQFLSAEIKSERGGFSSIVGRYFIQEKNKKLYVFYTKKGEKYGLDIWSKNKLLTSLEIKDIPVYADQEGNYYLIEETNFPKIIKSKIEMYKE